MVKWCESCAWIFFFSFYISCCLANLILHLKQIIVEKSMVEPGKWNEKSHVSICGTKSSPCGDACNILMVLMIPFLCVIGFILVSSSSWCNACRQLSHDDTSTYPFLLLFSFFPISSLVFYVSLFFFFFSSLTRMRNFLSCPNNSSFFYFFVLCPSNLTTWL